MPRISFVIIIILFFIPFHALSDEEGGIFNTTAEEQDDFGITVFKGWDDTEKTLFVVSEILLIADWGQSLDINRKGVSDNNPILNHAPISTVNTYFAAWLVANYFITDNLPNDYRKMWLVGLVLGEIVFVGSNAGVGINIAF